MGWGEPQGPAPCECEGCQRDTLASLRAELAAERDRGRDEERAAVVAFLARDHGTMVANGIRRGEHWAHGAAREAAT